MKAKHRRKTGRRGKKEIINLIRSESDRKSVANRHRDTGMEKQPHVFYRGKPRVGGGVSASGSSLRWWFYLNHVAAHASAACKHRYAGSPASRCHKGTVK